ncbi:hypothetical protein PF003_g33062 [Phytophthora fragariae]|nr:hypothetical protein PF003_g33062 [Phytophthora fragariae]
MAEQARQKEEARLARVSSARTRSERAQALTSLRSHQQQECGPHVPDEDTDEDDNAGADKDAGDDADDKAGEEGGGHEKSDEEGGNDEKVDEEEEGGDEEGQGGDEEEWEDDEQSDREEECQEENQGSAEAESEMAGEGIDSRAQAKAKRRRGKKRSVSDVEEDTLVRVPGFKAQHDSWPELEASLQEYMEATRQKIVIKEVINTARRNAELRAQVRFRGRPDSEIPLVPAEMDPYQRKYICTHGWSERERSTGKRTSHMLHRTECPFHMLAQVTKKCDGMWGITMKREVFWHNHVVSEDIYRSYPGIRQVSVDSPLMPGIDLLVDAQAGTQSVYDYIRKNSNHRVTMDDVGNMIRRMRNKGKFRSEK